MPSTSPGPVGGTELLLGDSGRTGGGCLSLPPADRRSLSLCHCRSTGGDGGRRGMERQHRLPPPRGRHRRGPFPGGYMRYK